MNLRVLEDQLLLVPPELICGEEAERVAIEEGIRQADAGMLHSHASVMKEMEQLLGSSLDHGSQTRSR